ncbi:hypothetical protein EIP91_009226 [Steccherinum ochraceum]|uniref:F-box domain-containing protein n=1 Tax=Steccherinum ochraceum TaxID=92696 RepID=A0A4R0S008_9APHY|nr:hypothetical protein EIP91_009226 [Steccherinum ochraceum]
MHRITHEGESPEDSSTSLNRCDHPGDKKRIAEMVLNWDTLNEVMTMVALLDWRSWDLSRMTRTCRTLHEMGVPLLLSFDIRIGSFRSVASFAIFIRKHCKHAHLVRHLTIEQCFFYEEDGSSANESLKRLARRFSRTLKTCSQLEELRILSAEEVFQHRSIATAMASLRNLRKIDFSFVGPHAIQAIRNMRSPITSATLFFEDDERQFGEESIHRDPVYLFQGFADSLVKISLGLAGSVASDDFTVRYPNVRSIALEASFFDADPDAFASCFPNLRELEWANDMTNLNEAAEIREFNLAVRNPVIHSLVGWKTLSRLHLNIERLYSMALSCDVGYWTGARLSGDDVQLAYFKTILADIRLSHLHLSVFAKTILQEEQIFPVSSITHLEMDVPLADTNTDIRQVLV